MEPKKKKRSVAWKAAELNVAKAFGGVRSGPTGRTGADVKNLRYDWLSIEVKERKDAIPFWIRDAVRQITACTSPDKLPIVILHKLGDRHNNDLVVIQRAKFMEFFVNDLPEEEFCYCDSQQPHCPSIG